jgi:glycosyltransferase involved in cell wall biosynthesis
MSIIAVDLTPVMPGGENGGAKILALELLKSFQKIAPEDHFLLLTASWNHEELAMLDGHNMSRLLVLKHQRPPLKLLSDYNLGGLERRLRRIFRFVKRKVKPVLLPGHFLRDQGVELLFCPFTAPTYAEPGIPVVSVVLDLQHRVYPQFFSYQEIDGRDAFFYDCQQKASNIICISESVRQTTLKFLKTNPRRTFVIPVCIQTRLDKLEPEKVNAHLIELGIDGQLYMFYPANFWPHKNHRILLIAFKIFLSRNRAKKIDLVFTGALNDQQKILKDEVRRMGLAKRVHFLGFLPQDQLSAVWHGCQFLIYPSLYEGFGIPVLEAMSFGKPVVCSNTTSLPEVAGDAALYFDPRKPKDIVRCLEQIDKDPDLRDTLVSRGYQRAAMFRPEDMACKYLEIFRSSLNISQDPNESVTGVYEDGWTGKDVHIFIGKGKDNHLLELQLEAPPFLPARRVRLVLQSKNRVLQIRNIDRGKKISIRHSLRELEYHLTVSVTPTFRPSEFDIGSDNRKLGVLCHECWLVSPKQGRISLLNGKEVCRQASA